MKSINLSNLLDGVRGVTPRDAIAVAHAAGALRKAGFETLAVETLAKPTPQLRVSAAIVLRVLAQAQETDLSHLLHELARLDILARRKPPAWVRTTEPPRPYEPPGPRSLFTKEQWRQMTTATREKAK